MSVRYLSIPLLASGYKQTQKGRPYGAGGRKPLDTEKQKLKLINGREIPKAKMCIKSSFSLLFEYVYADPVVVERRSQAMSEVINVLRGAITAQKN